MNRKRTHKTSPSEGPTTLPKRAKASTAGAAKTTESLNKTNTKVRKKKQVENAEVFDEDLTDVDSQDHFPLWKVNDALSNATGVSSTLAENFVKLIEEENTLPFIARYRKSLIDHMTPEGLQDLYDCYINLCDVRRKAGNILKTLKKNGKLTHDLNTSIVSARSMGELDLLYEPLKERGGTLADKARELGLEQAAQNVLSGNYVNISSFCDSSRDGLKSFEDVETNIIHLLADIIYKDLRVLDKIRTLKQQTSFYVESSKSSSKTKQKEKSLTKKGTAVAKKDFDADKYSLYFNFKLKVDYVKPHQILAINRGESAKTLSVKINIPDWLFNNLERFCLTIWNGPLIKKAVADAYKRLIKPWLVRRIRSEMTVKAEKESVVVFTSNLKRLLMTAPIKGRTILGIDPGFKAGCKIGIINGFGQALDTCVLFPKFNSNVSSDNELKKLQQLIDDHGCEVIALGNGTACRETEQWLKKWKMSDKLPLIIVPEQGASIYSCSPEATKEHPGMDPNLISALSIARRALDPLSELVKVQPKHVGVGLYQHDITPKLLNEALNSTVVYCASFVGADLNTASVTLLRKIAGLTEIKANAIVKYREKNGLFKCRDDLLKVSGIGPKIFKQCAGFLRVPQSNNKLDNTWIHPESYAVSLKLLKELKLSPKDIGSSQFIRDFKSKTSALNLESLPSKLNCIKSDIELVVEALCHAPHEDPLRNNQPIYSMSVNNIDQIKVGTRLTGVISNVTPFGCFVDCGVGRDGLIHTSQMGGSRIPQLGERVKVMIVPPLTDKIKLKLEQIIC